jgi:hypothetical protein
LEEIRGEGGAGMRNRIQRGTYTEQTCGKGLRVSEEGNFGVEVEELKGGDR